MISVFLANSCHLALCFMPDCRSDWMTTTSGIVGVLGGKTALRKKVGTAVELTEAIREGLPYASLQALLDRLHLTRSEAAVVLHLPERTLARRRKEKRLRPDESDRVLRLARLFSL